MMRHRVSVKRIERIGTTVCADVALWGAKVVTFAILVCASAVGGWSTFGVYEVQNSKEGVGKLVYIICLQVPPRPPEETVKRLSLFCPFSDHRLPKIE